MGYFIKLILISLVFQTATAFAGSYDYLLGIEQNLGFPEVPKFRKLVKNAYRSPLGLQVHSYCFEVAKKRLETQGLPYDQKKAEAAVELWIQRIVDKMFANPGGCIQKYPQLDKFFYEWLTQARRTVLTCSPKDSNSHNAGAMYIPDGNELLGLPSAAVQGLDLGTNELSARSFKPTIILPSDTFVKALGGENPERQDMELIHEIFHATGANNRQDHNHIQSVSSRHDSKNVSVDSCRNQVADDRISMLSTMCAQNTALFGENTTVEEALYKRVLKCGPLKGCVTMIRDSDSSFDDLKSTKISNKSAVAFCAGVVEEQSCKAWATKNMAEVLTDPQISLPRAEVRKRLDALLPAKAKHLPRALIDTIPSARDELQGKALSSCVTAATVKDEQGGLYPKNVHHATMPLLNPVSRGYAGTDSLWMTMTPFIEAIKATPECQDPETQARAIKAFQMIGDEMKLALNSSGYLHLADYAFQDKPERVRVALDESPGFGLTAAPLLRTDEKAAALMRLLGNETYNNYLAALERFHPESDRLDCLALGLRPRTTLNMVKNQLQYLPRISQINPSCPDSQ